VHPSPGIGLIERLMNNAIVSFGEVLLRLSSPDKECLLQSPRFEAHVGGAEANVAVSLHRLGHRARMISALPDSALGRACADELRRYGVDIDEIRFRDGRMGLYFLTHGAGHRPAEVLYDRANSAFASAPADLYDWDALLAEAAWLHVSGITPAVSAAAADAALAAMAAARRRDVQISFDCNFRARLWGARADEAPPILRRLCEQADLIFGDERDIEFMLGRRFDDASAPRKRRQAADAAFEAFSHLKHLACTDRARHSVDVQQLTGCLQDKSSTWSSRSYPLHGIVDRIGAGDAFAAGVLHGLIGGFAPQEAVDFGTAAAVLKHSIPGDFNLVTVADVNLLLSEQSVDVRR
jgi:2-dehydro-3-deoxygluconokinase